MRNFLKPNKNILFNSCNGCIDCCKNYPFMPLFLDEFKSAHSHFPIVFAKINNAKYALAVLFDNKDSCRYLKNGICDNYSNRLSGCKIYPIIPYEDDIFYDESCKALNFKTGVPLFKDDEANEPFYNSRLENFSQKRKELVCFLENIWNELIFYKNIKDVDILSYNFSTDNEFLKYHQASLCHIL
ncbi:MAG: hypothetical protein RL154_605 [Pseudomonadota bacterium]|jgi:Fe-S-cluster containining protein